MCGFVGFANWKDGFDPGAVINDMMDTIRHRGPDSGGVYTDSKVALGFRRLMIIDLSAEGSQPMYNEDKSCILIFNGEIYNFQELREDLVAKGHQFVSHTDSEVILHGYEEYGEAIVGMLRGMFAFAIRDTRNDTLLLARDPFGIKPLYYTNNTSDGSLLFGSEIKSFLGYPTFRKELNKQALKPYLTFQYSVLDETFFKGVFKLRPGHLMVFKNGEMAIKPYWEPAFGKPDERASMESTVAKIRETMRESVDSHKISDVKVGAFLSGGIDSSYTTALLMPDKTFSVGFKDYEGIFNETNLAEALSDQLGIENHRRLIGAEECFDALPTIQYHMDEPHANLSSVPLYFLAELAREHVTVVLSGEGADELFGGYVWYQKSRKLAKYEKIPFGLRRAASRAVSLLPAGKLTNFIRNGGLRVEERFIGQAKIFSEQDANAVLKPAYQGAPSVDSIVGPHYDKMQDMDDVTKMQSLDLRLWLPGDILLKADKMSMAHSLELRVPFLDKEVMRTASTIPTSYRVNEHDTKLALRAAALEVLPKEWANREKVGFPVPIRHWLREEKYYALVKQAFASDTAEQFFHTDELIKYLDAHYAGEANHARYIWTVYVFLVWYERFFEQ